MGVTPPANWKFCVICIVAAHIVFQLPQAFVRYMFGTELDTTGDPRRVGDLMRVIIPTVAALLYGMYRVSFYPSRRYSQWLFSTPWHPELPLPLGPVHLVWQDLVVVVGLMGLATAHVPPISEPLFSGVALPWGVIPAIGFLAGYIAFALFIFFVTLRLDIPLLLILSFGLSAAIGGVWRHTVVGVLIGSLGICGSLVALQRCWRPSLEFLMLQNLRPVVAGSILDQFASSGTNSEVNERRLGACVFTQLAPRSDWEWGLGRRETHLLLAILLGLGLVIVWFQSRITDMCLIQVCVIVLVACVRLLAYLSGGHAPPFGWILQRKGSVGVVNFRTVFYAPALSCLLTAIGVGTTFSVSQEYEVAVLLAWQIPLACLSLYLLLEMGPGRSTWRLTGSRTIQIASPANANSRRRSV